MYLSYPNFKRITKIYLLFDATFDQDVHYFVHFIVILDFDEGK